MRKNHAEQNFASIVSWCECSENRLIQVAMLCQLSLVLKQKIHLVAPHVNSSRPNLDRWFAEEVQPHEPMLRSYVRKQFPALPDVDDVMQETHLRLLRAHEKGRIQSVKAYLYAIARSVAIGVFRKKGPHTEIAVNDLVESSLLKDAADVAETASINQEFALATEAIDRLPGRCREIVVLRALHGLSHKEIAERLGISEQTVRVQVARGMKKCAQYLRDHGVNGGSHDNE